MYIPEIRRSADPKRKVQIQCVNCQNFTVHDVMTELKQDFRDGHSNWYEDYIFEILMCCGCFSVSFRSQLSSLFHDFNGGEEGEVSPETEIYPPRKVGRKVLRDLRFIPMEVRLVYMETHKAIVSNQPLLAAIGIRAIVETVCKNTGATERTLPQKIDGLVTRGLLSGSGAVILKEIKVYGDEAAHEAKPNTEPALSRAMDIVEHLLEGVYIHPQSGKDPFEF